MSSWQKPYVNNPTGNFTIQTKESKREHAWFIKKYQWAKKPLGAVAMHGSTINEKDFFKWTNNFTYFENYIV